ncbi:MAG TPA: MBOAT family O-acyltransferase [Nannocystaceae bacterium]|nr:MBOAT family O-acyltransferase [Nannocystaceae bacterium]
MLFPTFDFLLFCIPVLAIGWALARRAGPRTWFLLGASYFFYMAAPKTDPLPTPWYYVGLLLFSTALDYAAGLGIASQDVGLTSKYPEDRRRARRNRNVILGISLVGNLGLLGYYKYTDFFVHTAADVLTALGLPSFVPTIKLLLPVGISFYTFQSLSYTIDVWRGRLTTKRSLPKFALFVTFFPQLVAGPIVRANEFLPQLHRPPRLSGSRMEEGLFRIFKGLVKKVVLGDWIAAQLTDAIFASPESYTSGELLLALYAFTLQLYCDFSGYSDIAIGVGRLLGYDFPENFDRPYQSRDLGEFWRRWHMTLSTWLRDYLFFPLGGSRGSPARVYFNLWITMFLVGMWHYVQGSSWNFVIYANLHAAAMVFNRWNRIRDRGAPLVRKLLWWTPGLAVLACVIAGLSHAALDLPWEQSGGLAVFAVVAFLVVASLPMTGTRWNTALHIVLTFHFTVLSRVFFRAESFASAKTMLAGMLAFDGYGIRPGLVSPGVAAALALGIAYHMTPKTWVDVVALRWFRRIPGPVLGLALALLGLVFMRLMGGGPRAFIYFQF